MVCYCCVKGCKNNRNMKKKDPNWTVTFHAFPSNLELRTKWLKAIGRPNWEPPSHARLCSAHFTNDQIDHDRCRTRLKDYACPVNSLPLNSNFEASNVEVCRVCLATDLKMYNIQDGLLRTCMESITGFNESYNIEGLPQFVCFECAALLMKCYHLIEKSMVAQATLLDIFARNGQITKSLVKKQNRNQLNLSSSLIYHKPSYTLDIICDLEVDFNPMRSKLPSNYYVIKDEKDLYGHYDNSVQLENGVFEENTHEIQEESIKMEPSETKLMKEATFPDDKELLSSEEETREIIYFNDDDSKSGEDLKITTSISNENNDDDSLVEDKTLKTRSKITKGTIRKKSVNGLTPDEVDMQKYFDVVKLSLQEQMDEWKTRARRPLTSATVYECEICSKMFAHVNTYRSHISGHDQNRGNAECHVCKLRFKNEVLAKSHRKRTHSKQFNCKSCSKVFSSVSMAKKHHRWHIGHLYKCHICPFASAHESALGVHVRAHARAKRGWDVACARCGRACVSAHALRLHTATAHKDQQESEGDGAFRCKACDMDFMSEGARRVHILTSRHHKKSSDLCDPTPQDPTLKTTCSKCGEQFPSLRDLISHTKSAHRRPAQKKTSWRLPGDSYPTQCEHCGTTVNNRKEHWRHVRNQHPSEKGSYRAVITAVCDTCGKGFQNSTKLQHHTLRHSLPAVRCASCPRLFYDKYAAARHASVHVAARPHACRECGRAFRFRGNLHRHARVHTDATPYECTICGKKFKHSTSVNLHVRTVHHKLPHPPRKKRARARNNSDTMNCANM